MYLFEITFITLDGNENAIEGTFENALNAIKYFEENYDYDEIISVTEIKGFEEND